MRVGPRMIDVAAYVARHPGCPKLHAARYVMPGRGLQYGYRSVNRAINAGLVRAENIHRSRYALYPAVDNAQPTLKLA